MFEKEAEERAEKLEKNQTLGVYDNDEDLARDEGYNDGEVAGYENGFIEGAEFGYNKAKVELEKENAELKKQVKQKQHLADVRLEQSLENHNLFANERKERIDIDIALEDMTDNLTKAKELLRDLIRFQPYIDKEAIFLPIGNEWKIAICKAEQFLREVSE